MNARKNAALTSNAKDLRKHMTKEERRLWYDCLKQLPITVNRQKVIGQYIVDFYCAAARLIIELDGSQHFTEEQQDADSIRDAYLHNLGLVVLRYSNREINYNFSAVCEDIARHIALRTSDSPSSTASGPPSPEGEG